MREKLGDKLSTAVTLHTSVLLGSRGPVTSTTGDVHPGALYLSQPGPLNEPDIKYTLILHIILYIRRSKTKHIFSKNKLFFTFSKPLVHQENLVAVKILP